MPERESPPHFKGREAIEHVAQAQAEGMLSTAEIHGAEIPGHIFAGADAARESAVILLIIWLILSQAPFPITSAFQIMGIFSFGWILWKAGRSAWLAWSRLERMHRIVEQERWEIQHHRPQEREELKELYRAKGFEGQLLEDVIDVLMADEDRLLRVMVEEELCLSLENQEHPLKQALGAAAGTAFACAFCLFFLFLNPGVGLWFGSFIALATAAAVSATYENNRVVAAIAWNLGLAALACGAVYFLFDYVNGSA